METLPFIVGAYACSAALLVWMIARSWWRARATARALAHAETKR